MIKYFKELLSVLKSIDKRLETIENNQIKSSDVVRKTRNDRKYISTNPGL